MDALECFDLFLRFGSDHALAVKLAVGTGVGLVAGGEEVGGDVAFASDEGDDLDFLGDVGELGEELGGGVAFEDVFGDGVAGFEGVGEARLVGVVEKELGLEDFGGVLGDGGVVTEGEVEQGVHGGSALHVGEKLEGEGGGDFGDGFFAEDDFLEETGFFASGAGGAGEGVVDEEFEGLLAVLVGGVFDLGDDFGEKVGAIDGEGVEALWFAGFDFGEVVGVEAHFCKCGECVG